MSFTEKARNFISALSLRLVVISVESGNGLEIIDLDFTRPSVKQR